MPRKNRIAKLVAGLGVAATALIVAAAPASASTPTDTAEQLLAAHNEHREQVKSASLMWDESLAAGAQAWADYLLATGRLEHASNLNGTGENLYASSGFPSAADPARAVHTWAAERKLFFAQPEVIDQRSYEKWGHWAQIVWPGAERVGCAVAAPAELGSKNPAKQIVVCRYDEMPQRGHYPVVGYPVG